MLLLSTCQYIVAGVSVVSSGLPTHRRFHNLGPGHDPSPASVSTDLSQIGFRDRQADAFPGRNEARGANTDVCFVNAAGLTAENVRYGSKADINTVTHLRPLSGAKQTFNVRFSSPTRSCASECPLSGVKRTFPG